MKRLIPVFAMILGWAVCAWAEAPGPLTSLHAIQALSNAEAEQRMPAAFEGTVTYFNRNTKVLNVQENDEAIFVDATTDVRLVPGDRVLVKGTVGPSFLPFVQSNDVTLLRHGSLPRPIAASFDDLVHKKINCRYVRVQGVVRAADMVSAPTAPAGRIQLLMDGGYIDLEVDSHDADALKSLLDSEVEATGAAGRKFDGKMQQTGAKVKVSSLANIKVLRRASANPWSLPETPLAEIITGYHVHDLTQRLLVHGTITYYQPGSAVVLQSGTSSLWIATQTSEPMQIGDIADATGFPETHDNLLTLTRAEIHDSHVQAPVQPKVATWRQLALFGRRILGGHAFDLVSIEGRVVTEVREAMQDEYILVSDGRVFSAIYRHPPAPGPLPPMLQVPLDSTIRVIGICMIADPNPVKDEAPFDILLRSFDDIAVVAGPPSLSVRNLIIVIGLLFAAVIAVGTRSWALERMVRRQTAAIAYIERSRSQILENISGSLPLAEIIEQITQMVTFKLRGAPCWCQIADGARLGNMPPDLTGLRVIHDVIRDHSGRELGKVLAALHSLAKPAPEESEALSMGVALAKLAIETRQLYSDLVHRSEFDLLTDIQNRFSLDKHLDALIETASQAASIFGLIYIDLDEFKQVNDEYGHQVGDLYLQEVAERMKRQLRPGDMLARLGGDEFAVLVPVIRCRTDVEEIALRLERCFDNPFAVEGYVLSGSASVGIAIYPADGSTRDGLLSAADAAMYVAKNTKRQMPAKKTDPEFTL